MRHTLVLSALVLTAACHSHQQLQPSPDLSAVAPSADGKIPITTRSDAARALFLRGRALNEQLQPHEGYAFFAQAVAADSSFAMAEYSLATVAFTGRERAAHLARAVSLTGQVSPGEALLILALKARTNADPATGLQDAEQLVSQYPRDERAHWVLANAYFAQQLWDRSIVEYLQAIAINPTFSLGYNSLGYAFRAAGRMADAEKAFRRYIALVPDNPNPYDSYAELLMKTGRFDASIVQYRRALAIDPHFGGSYVGIATDEMYAGRYAASIAEAKEYLAAARDDGERRTAMLTAALSYVDEGETDSALATMRRRYDIASATGDTASMSADGIAIGDILLAAGRLAAARDRYHDAHELVVQSRLSPAVKDDDALGQRYDVARVALAGHDLATAHREATAYLDGATTRRNDVRVRQAHQLAGMIALDEEDFDRSLTQLTLADQQDPAVILAMAQAYEGKGARKKSRALARQAANQNNLPAFASVFVRAMAHALAQH